MPVVDGRPGSRPTSARVVVSVTSTLSPPAPEVLSPAPALTVSWKNVLRRAGVDDDVAAGGDGGRRAVPGLDQRLGRLGEHRDVETDANSAAALLARADA